MVKISIIIPVYNVEDYLDDAFNSILNQSIGFENLQVIFVDDASTDSSPQIIKKYSEEYENVIYIFLDKNSGYSGLPRNVGMEYANADYLMFLDPDDVFTENACEILYSQITCDNLDIVCGVHSDGDEVPEWIWKNLLTDPQESWDIRTKKCQDMLNNPNFELKINSIDEYPSIISAANIWDKIFKKSLIEENNITFPPFVPAQDSVFLLNAFLNASGIKFINEIIVLYNSGRPDSSQNQFSKDKILKRKKCFIMFEIFQYFFRTYWIKKWQKNFTIN